LDVVQATIPMKIKIAILLKYQTTDEQAIETTDENNGTPDDDTQHQGEPVDTDYNPEDPSKDNSFCEYEGLAGYEPGDIVLSFDFCKPLTCKNGKFAGVDGDFCDGCRYWNDPEKEGELGEMMKFSCNGEAERNWCECVKDDLGTKKWACYYSHACQCIYDDDGKRYDLGYEIATDFCQTSTCSDGFFDFLDWEACDHCYYYDVTMKQRTPRNKRRSETKGISSALTEAKSTGANVLRTIILARNGNA